MDSSAAPLDHRRMEAPVAGPSEAMCLLSDRSIPPSSLVRCEIVVSGTSATAIPPVSPIA